MTAAFVPPAAAAGGSSGSQTVTSGGEIVGTMSTEVAAVIPATASVTLPIKIGEAGSQTDGKVRQAQSQAIDLGLLGAIALSAVNHSPTLTKLGIPVSQLTAQVQLPPASVSDSRDGIDRDDSTLLPSVDLGPVALKGVGRQLAKTSGGLGIARTEMPDLSATFGPLTLDISGAAAETQSDADTISATTTIGKLSIASGSMTLVSLGGLVWHSVHKFGQKGTGSFGVGAATVGGLPLPSLPTDALAPLTTALSKLFAPFGFVIGLPQVTDSGDISPMVLSFVNPPAGTQFVQPFYSSILAAPIDQLESELGQLIPETGLALTVANVFLGAITGEGGMTLQLGGTSGTIGRAPIDTYTYSGGGETTAPGGTLPITQTPTGPSSGHSSTLSATSGASVIAATGGGGGGGEIASTSGTAGSMAGSGAATTGSSAGFGLIPDLTSVIDKEHLPALLIILLGLAAAVGLAAADRRRIAAIVESEESR